MKETRILAVIETLGIGGGAEQLLVDLIPTLKKYGIHCDLMTLFDWIPDMTDMVEASGHHVYRMRCKSWWSPAKMYKALQTVTSNKYTALWSHLQRAHLFAGTLVTLNRDIAHAAVLHTARPDRMLSPIEHAEKALLSRRSSHVFAVSEATASQYRDAYNLENIKRVYNGVNIDRIRRLAHEVDPMETRAALGVREDAFLIIVPARYAINKGHIVLIEALEKLKHERRLEPTVLCFGYGGLRLALKQRARERSLQNIRFYDRILFERLVRNYVAANLVLIPSLREPFGLAATEAMSLGIPTLLTAIEGYKEITSKIPNYSLLVPPNDPTALANKIADVMLRPEEYKNQTQVAQRNVEEYFSMETCARNWANELLTLCGVSSSPSRAHVQQASKAQGLENQFV